MNLYKGRHFGWLYCDSRCDLYKVQNFNEIEIKKDFVKLLEEELKS